MNHFVIGAAFALAAGMAFADSLPEITYDGFSVSYTRLDLPEIDEDADAFAISGSVEIFDGFHLWGSFAHSNADYTLDPLDRAAAFDDEPPSPLSVAGSRPSARAGNRE